jgi:cytochrome c553
MRPLVGSSEILTCTPLPDNTTPTASTNRENVMNKLFPLILFAALAPALSHAAGDAAVGKSKAAICAACHGVNGISPIPTYPNLAGQHEGYLVEALHAYKNKQRISAQAMIMQVQAAALSDDDINNLAAYFASLK